MSALCQKQTFTDAIAEEKELADAKMVHHAELVRMSPAPS
jgi:hypothetical protein